MPLERMGFSAGCVAECTSRSLISDTPPGGVGYSNCLNAPEAVYAANGGRPRLPGRQLAAPTGIPWETLYRRYHEQPKKMPPPAPPSTEDIARLL